MFFTFFSVGTILSELFLSELSINNFYISVGNWTLKNFYFHNLNKIMNIFFILL
uniref:Uncharacterized protein n=1 Tax=Meloidogyne enterolobii TaxID=390850 RepID=A0A6V7TPR8_MELEN|nr:unnamed protein product [Meloidogyne enterolobii]